MPVWGEGDEQVHFNFWTPNTGGIEMAFAPDNSRITGPLQIDWDDVDVARKTFLGYATVEQDDVTRWVERHNPLPYFDSVTPARYGADPWLFATSISRVEGLGPDGETSEGGPDYLMARAWTVFTPVTYGILTDAEMRALPSDLGGQPDESNLARYVSGPYWGPYSRQVTLRRGMMKSILGGGTGETVNTIAEGIARPEPGAEITYIHHLLPLEAVPFQAIANAMGKVNDAEFDGIFPAETLLVESPNLKHYISPAGLPVVDLQLRFKFLPRTDISGVSRGWNWLLTYVKGSSTYDYRKYTVDGEVAGSTSFETTDLKLLFRPDQP